MENETRKTMSLQDFVELTKYVQENHSSIDGKRIKYITPHYDTRAEDIFSVQFRGFLYPEKTFSLVNENKDRDLKEWIYSWLNDNRN